MQFLITAYDGKDEDALSRRLSVREKHLETITKLKDQGKVLYGLAILDDDGKMIGSTMVAQFDSEEQMRHEWLDAEVYVTANVWQEIKIQPCNVAGIFLP